jgi:hypothetical protein
LFLSIFIFVILVPFRRSDLSFILHILYSVSNYVASAYVVEMYLPTVSFVFVILQHW